MKIFSLLLAFLFSTSVFSQIKIQGTVTDASSTAPLIGVNVVLKQSGRTLSGTITDLDGSYEIALPAIEGYELEFSYTGYVTQRVSKFKISEGKSIRLDVRLSSAGVELSEVVVTSHAPIVKRKNVSAAAKMADMGRISSPPATMGIVTYDMAVARSAPTARGSRSGPAIPGIEAGTLTAGEVHDFSKWDLWQDIADIDLERWRKHWDFNPTERYTVQAMTAAGQPIADAEVKMFSGNDLVWTSRTDNTGRAELWANVFAEGEKKQSLRAEVRHVGQVQKIDRLSAFQQGLNTVKFQAACEQPDVVDLLFVVDATGSMGDEIEFLKIELADVIAQAQAGLPGDLRLNLGSVFYRDEGDEYLTRTSDFSEKIAQTTEFIQAQRADGGGDGPEAVETALGVAIRDMAWSDEARARLLFLVLDAPPHHTPEIIAELQTLSREAAAKGIRIIPVTGSGIDKGTEYLMRSLALTTNGTYTFLTNHSGIGGDHIEPTADTYDVEKLNALLVRLIRQFATMPGCEEPVAEVEPLFPTPPVADSVLAKLGLRAFPNPSSGPMTVELKQPVEELFVTDLTGKILLRYAGLPEGQTPIDLANLPNGSYLLRTEVEDVVVSERVVVLH